MCILGDGHGGDPHGESPPEIYERITDAFYALDEDWQFTYVNKRAEDIIRRSAAEVLGESIWEAFPEARDSVVWEKYHEAMETQEPVDFELYYEPLDVWAEVNAYPSETSLSVYFHDISERIEREQQLRRYQRIIETVNDGVYAVDPEGRFTMVNDAYAELFGYDREELLGEHVSKIVSDEIAEAAQEIEAAQVAGEREAPSLEAEIETADGETVVAEATFALLSDENGAYERIGVVRDVTERKEYERRLKEQCERYRRFVEAVPVAIVTCDANGRIVFANEAAAEQSGMGGDLVGTSALELVHADDRDEVADRLHRVLERREAVPPTEIRLETGDGVTCHAITTGVPITNEDEPAGQFVLTDITERKRYEQQLNETVTELEASNERLDSFASMLAHELRNPLNVAEIYLQQIEDDSTAADRVSDALDRIEGMIDVLLMLAKGSDAVSKGQALALADIATDAWEMLDTRAASLDVETTRVVRADENQIRHLLENVFENALEHGGEGVTVRVGDLPSGFYVEDDGPGITADERDDVFEADYSTEEGLGLGLTFVARLADAYGWDCEATESEAGGARFEFTGVAFADEE
ncbi:hypothetical protein BRC82_10180 [Halobacteriales archaeon QS_1_67_19]|nr:MAG: hypothetical protein BRC82_10180 [Halobacteriales archaeon QS_1_67_19]